MAQVTGIILAGGRSSRFGSDKAFATWGGKTMIEAVINSLLPILPRVLVVTKTPDRFAFLESERITIVSDVFPGSNSIGGLFSGLLASGTTSFVCGCDMPLLQ